MGCLVYARRLMILSTSPHPPKAVFLLCPFYRWGDWGLGRLNSLPTSYPYNVVSWCLYFYISGSRLSCYRWVFQSRTVEAMLSTWKMKTETHDLTSMGFFDRQWVLWMASFCPGPVCVSLLVTFRMSLKADVLKRVVGLACQTYRAGDPSPPPLVLGIYGSIFKLFNNKDKSEVLLCPSFSFSEAIFVTSLGCFLGDIFLCFYIYNVFFFHNINEKLVY